MPLPERQGKAAPDRGQLHQIKERSHERQLPLRFPHARLLQTDSARRRAGRARAFRRDGRAQFPATPGATPLGGGSRGQGRPARAHRQHHAPLQSGLQRLLFQSPPPGGRLPRAERRSLHESFRRGHRSRGGRNHARGRRTPAPQKPPQAGGGPTGPLHARFHQRHARRRWGDRALRGIATRPHLQHRGRSLRYGRAPRRRGPRIGALRRRGPAQARRSLGCPSL